MSSIVENNATACKDCLAASRPIHKASTTGHIPCLQRFLNSSTNTLEFLDDFENTPLHAAAGSGQIGALKFLLEKQVIPVKAKNQAGQTCGHIAAGRSGLTCLKILLGGPLKPAENLAFEQDRLGSTLLHSALLVNDNDVAVWLLQRFGKSMANIPNHDGVLPLHVAAAKGNIEFIRIATKYDLEMVNRRDRNGASAVFYAVEGGHLVCLKYLVEKAKADLTAVTKRGQSLLHAAALNGHGHVVHWLLANMHRNAIHQVTADSASSFHCAAYGGHVNILKLLHKSSGCKKFLISGADRHGNTALHLSAINNRVYCARYLLEIGAEARAKNKNGHTPIDIAERRGHQQLALLLSASLKGKKEVKRILKDLGLNGKFQSPLTLSTSGYGSTLAAPSTSARPRLPVPESRRSPMDRSSGYASSSDNLYVGRMDTGKNFVTWEQEKMIRGRIDDNWLMRRNETELMNQPSCSRRRILVESATQTDPDPLEDDILIVDDEERVLFRSFLPLPGSPVHRIRVNHTAGLDQPQSKVREKVDRPGVFRQKSPKDDKHKTELMLISTGESDKMTDAEVKYAGIDAAERMAKMLDEEENRRPETAPKHAEERIEKRPKGLGPPLIPPILYNPACTLSPSPNTTTLNSTKSISLSDISRDDAWTKERKNRYTSAENLGRVHSGVERDRVALRQMAPSESTTIDIGKAALSQTPDARRVCGSKVSKILKQIKAQNRTAGVQKEPQTLDPPTYRYFGMSNGSEEDLLDRTAQKACFQSMLDLHCPPPLTPDRRSTSLLQMSVPQNSFRF